MPQLFWYKLLFMTQLIIAEMLFSFRLEKQKYFLLRLIGGILCCYVLALVYPLASYSGWYASLMFISMFLAAFLLLKFAFKTSWVNALFCVITAYTVQHLSYQLFTLLSLVTGLGGMGMYGDTVIDFSVFSVKNLFNMLVYIEVCVVVYWLAYMFVGRRLGKSGEIQLKNTYLLVLAGLILLVDIILNAFVVYIQENYNKTYDIIVGIYNVLCCLLVFYIQLSVVNVKKMQKEIETVSQLLHQARQQYAISKENINLINLKCHNLKHQVRQFAQKGGIDRESISEIEEMISIYDAAVETGNEALDVILTEKSLLCHKNGINLTCMADCSDLAFISESDLYVLFGNAVDNAIEAVMRLDDENKRYIGLTVHTVGALITLNMNNYYEGKCEFGEDGMPLTTKMEKDFHGYGMKSIKMIVDKYGGDLSVVVGNGVFNLNIFFPLPRGSKSSKNHDAQNVTQNI